MNCPLNRGSCDGEQCYFYHHNMGCLIATALEVYIEQHTPEESEEEKE